MSDMQTFPQTWQEFANDYTFNDYKEFYTNGIELIPLFRIEQMMGHYYDSVVTENANLREDLEFERSENGWAREFLDRMAKHCGTKDCSSLAAYVEELESENAKLIELNNIRILQTQHCEDLTAENERMRELLRGLYSFAFQEYPDGVERNFADELRKLGIEVETDED